MIDASSFPTDRLTFVTFHDDGSVSAYLGRVWLCNEDNLEAAEREARGIISAYDHGAYWAREEFPGLAMGGSGMNNEQGKPRRYVRPENIRAEHPGGMLLIGGPADGRRLSGGAPGGARIFAVDGGAYVVKLLTLPGVAFEVGVFRPLALNGDWVARILLGYRRPGSVTP